MGDVTGFQKYQREEFSKEPPEARKQHYKEFIACLSDEALQTQGARCMSCGVPFCHWACPVGNIIPEWNDLVYRGHWEEAVLMLHKYNNFPEVTGRICPALCEDSCVMELNQPAVTIRNIEVAIIEKAFREGWIKPNPPALRTGQRVAVVGSGPAGLACAEQLNKAGHTVTVFEKNEVPGGIMVLGIPDFKLEKWVIERRVDLMEKEGVLFKTGVCIGEDISIKYILKEHDAVVLSCGAEERRELNIPGRELKGVYQAMEYLMQQNRVNRGLVVDPSERITAHGKNVVVLGGGDTGSDCVGTANRQGAKSVRQFELLPRPPGERTDDNPWPQWAMVYRRSTSHDEGVEQDYAILTKELTGENGTLQKLHAVRLEWGPKDPQTGRRSFTEIPGSLFSVDCDLLVLAMGFTGPKKTKLFDELGLEQDQRGNLKADKNYMTNVPGVFAAGDMRRGQSLVVWAIKEGREAAHRVDKWLQKK